MPSTAVQDNLQVSLSEVKDWLRLTDVLVGRVDQFVDEDATEVQLDDVEFLNKGMYLTIDRNSYRIESVDYLAKTVEVSPAMPETFENTPVYSHPHDQMLINMVEAAKFDADEYLNNPFIHGVPPQVKNWILMKVALDYERPEAGVERTRIDKGGEKWYDEELIYNGIQHLRMYPV